MFKKLFYVVGFIFSLAAYSQEIKIEVKSAKERYILGEPCYIKFIVDNKSEKVLPTDQGSFYDEKSPLCLRIEGPRRKECDFLPRPVADRLPGCGSNIESGKKSEWENEMGILGLYSVGKFKLWVEYNPTIVNEQRAKNCNFYTNFIKSNVIEIEFVMPEGIDLEVFQKYHDNCNQITLKPSDLLQNYPTSTYAGYELAKCAKENLQDYINMSSEDIDEVLGVRGLITEKQDAYRNERKKYFEGKLKLLQGFIAVHPDFVKADMIRSGISFYLLVLGRQNEAIEEMKILSKMEGRWGEGAKKALERLFPEKENATMKE